MKIIHTNINSKVLLFLALTLSCLVLSSVSAKNNRLHSKLATKGDDLFGEESVTEECFKCYGPVTLFKHMNKIKYICECIDGLEIYYTSYGIDDSKKAKELKRESPWEIGSQNNQKIQKRIKAKYTAVDIYKKLDNKCNDFCGMTKKHKLNLPYKNGKYLICTCWSLIGSNDYYFLSYNHLASATAEINKLTSESKNDLNLDYILSSEANKELLPVPFDLTKFVNGGEDVAFSKRDAEDDLATESCVKCQGTAALFRNSSVEKMKPGKYFCVCNFNGKFTYKTLKVSGNDVGKSNKHSGPASAKYDEKIKKNYTPVNVYKKMENTCNLFCGVTGKHQLYKHLESDGNAHYCGCAPLIGNDKIFYSFKDSHIQSKLFSLQSKGNDPFLEAIAKKELVEVPLKTGRRFRK